jgi:hypothetical protein
MVAKVWSLPPFGTTNQVTTQSSWNEAAQYPVVFVSYLLSDTTFTFKELRQVGGVLIIPNSDEISIEVCYDYETTNIN